MRNMNTEFYGSSTVGERGQIVIPAEARTALNINPGDKFIFIGHGSILHIAKADEMDAIFEKIHQKFECAIKKIKDDKLQGNK